MTPVATIVQRRRPRLLDLYCGAGGAAMGYSQAGFDVTGVDAVPQPHFPFGFVQADALDFLRDLLADGLLALLQFDAIHASPPCQAYSHSRHSHGREHPRLLDQTRDLLAPTGIPWVIENVPGSPIRASFMLCGSSFGLGAAGRTLLRHRYFELSHPPMSLAPPCDHRGRKVIGVYAGGPHSNDGERWRGGWIGNAAEKREAMGIDWTNRDRIAQAIPPAYTHWIGREHLLPLLASNGFRLT